MADESHPFPNQSGGGIPPRGANPNSGISATVKTLGAAVKTMLGGVSQIEAKMRVIDTLGRSIAGHMRGTAVGPGFGGAGTGGVGTSGNSVMPGSLSSFSAIRSSTAPWGSAAGRLAGVVAGGIPPAGHQGISLPVPMSGLTIPGTSGRAWGMPPPPGGGGGGPRYGPGMGQPFIRRGAGGGPGFMGEKFGNAEAFFLPQLIGKVASNVQGFAGGAYDEDILANRLAVGNNGYTSGRKRDLFGMMAKGIGFGAYNAQDRQQAYGALTTNFTTRAIFGSSVPGGSGGGIQSQVTGLSQAMPGLGAAGAAQQMVGMNRPQIVNMARAFGVQVRDKNGGVNYERVANGLLNRIFGTSRNLSPDQIAYAFEPGNSAYYDLSNMGFDDDTIQTVKRIAMGRAQAGWSTNANLDNTAAGRAWRKKAGLSDNVTNAQLNRSGNQQVLKSTGTEGAVSGINATNKAMGDLGGAAADAAQKVKWLANALGWAGGAAGTLPGSPGSAQSGIGSSLLHSGAGGLSLGAQFATMAAASKFAAARAGGTAMMPALRGALPFAGAGAARLLAGGVGGIGGGAAGALTTYGLHKAGVHNKWATVGAGAGTGALTGAGIGALFGPADVATVPIGAALGGLAGGIAGFFAEGGMVPGGHNNDTVNIKATPGEVVVPRHTVSKHGGARKLMEKLGFSGAGRDGDGYAKGGEVVQRAIDEAEKYLGQPYHWGGSNPKTSFDCSGLMQWAYNSAGVRLPRTAAQQQNVGSAVKPGDAVAGDLVFLGNPAHHVMMYLGNGNVIEAPQTGDVIKEIPYNLSKASSIRRVADGGGTASVGAGSTTGGDSGDTGSGYSGAAFYRGSFGGSSVAIMRNFGAGGAAADSAAGATSGSGGTGAAPKDASGNTALAKSLAAAKGWTGAQWDALYAVWNQESGFKADAGSPGSAYGIPQALPGSKMADKNHGGGPDWKTNPRTQILWGLDYISGRYGDPIHAQAHKRATDSRNGSKDANAQPGGWYAQGAWETKDEIARLHQGEMVIPAKVADGVRTALREHGAGVTGGSGGGTVVHINLTIQKASDSEARRFAGIVKQQLEDDHALSQVASS